MRSEVIDRAHDGQRTGLRRPQDLTPPEHVCDQALATRGYTWLHVVTRGYTCLHVLGRIRRCAVGLHWVARAALYPMEHPKWGKVRRE